MKLFFILLFFILFENFYSSDCHKKKIKGHPSISLSSKDKLDENHIYRKVKLVLSLYTASLNQEFYEILYTKTFIPTLL